MSRRISLRGRRAHSGFTLIEVMIAVLVLAIGLLGFALLQTMSVRFAKSANQRGQATNLAYDMLDQMRSNRLGAITYVGNYAASTTATDCVPNATVGAAAFRTVWQCRLGVALGTDATATVNFAGGQATVAITWRDQRWNTAVPDTNFVVRTGL